MSRVANHPSNPSLKADHQDERGTEAAAIPADHTEQDRWDPVRDGDRYCSPGCGCKCTYEDYRAACQGATELCLQLGRGWSPYVWENGGWHYKALKGYAEVFVNIDRSGSDRPTTYVCYLQVPGRQVVGKAYPTPLGALQAALGDADVIVERLSHACAEVRR